MRSPVRPIDGAVGLVAAAVVSALGARPARAQACREPHYRWTQKVDTSLVTVSPATVSVTTILATWAPPELGPRDRCAPRGERERQTYELVAWVRRVDKFKDDGDWHLELTEAADSPADSCIVAEIPARRYGAVYTRARRALDSLIAGSTLRRGGVLRPPVRARIMGLAFFDGQHRRGGRRSDRIDGEHGRCNTSVRALWEIHPVFRVAPPPP